MVWSYSQDPSSSSKDTVRFYVGDTIEADPQISDEEITFLITEEGDNLLRAAARGAEMIAAHYARQVDKSVGGLSLSAGRRQEKYERLAKQLWNRASRVGKGLPTAYAGGISITDKIVQIEDTDRVRPDFHKDQMDNDSVIYGTDPSVT
jgi:predicted alpha/beta hydrolase family esterase